MNHQLIYFLPRKIKREKFYFQFYKIKLEGRDREFERAKKNSRGKKLEEQNGGGGGGRGRNGIIVIQLLAGTLWALLTVLLLQWPFLKPV